MCKALTDSLSSKAEQLLGRDKLLRWVVYQQLILFPCIYVDMMLGRIGRILGIAVLIKLRDASMTYFILL
jgi:hypothetical protein